MPEYVINHIKYSEGAIGRRKYLMIEEEHVDAHDITAFLVLRDSQNIYNQYEALTKEETQAE